jgi:dUTP pyrophosphatase
MIATFASMSKITVKVINESANPLPSYATAGSAGMDLMASMEAPVTLGSLERSLIPTGLFIELPEGYEAQVRPRSGLAAKFGLTVLNSPGTIDSDYRGEIKVILVNLSNQPQTIQPGERIAQMVISKVEQAAWEKVTTIAVTERNQGGFGHTGR